MRNDPQGPDGWLEVALLADDLTGACDAAAAFAGRGLWTEVGVDAGAMPGPECTVWALCTHTRDTAEEEVFRRLAGEFERLRGWMAPDAKLYKKIDSVFRGNTFVEIAATLQVVTDLPCVLAPAFPAMGRVARRGEAHGRDFTGEWTVAVVEKLSRLGVGPPVLAAGLPLEELARRLTGHWANGQRAVFCDAETDADLAAVVAAAGLAAVSPLWIGSGGLASALAAGMQRARVVTARKSGRTMFFVGSDHPVTRAQVDQLRRFALGGLEDNLAVVEVGFGEGAMNGIARQMAAVAPREVACVLMTGGDTAALVCGALGIESIRVTGEFAPGLAEGFARGGRFDGVPMVLKSGGFGDVDVFCRVAEAFSQAVSRGGL